MPNFSLVSQTRRSTQSVFGQGPPPCCGPVNFTDVQGINNPLSGGGHQFYVLACESTCKLHFFQCLRTPFKKSEKLCLAATVRTILKV